MKISAPSIATLLLVLLVVRSDALKILIAGDFEPKRREFFWSVAQRIASSPKTGHSVVFLTPEL